MIKIENTNDVVKVVDDVKDNNIKHIVLNKSVILKPYEKAFFETGLFLKCDESYEIAHITGKLLDLDDNEKNTFIINAGCYGDGDYITTVVYNSTDKDLIIPNNTEIAYVTFCHTLTDTNNTNDDIFFYNNGISIKDENKRIDNVEVIIDENGNESIVIKLIKE